KLAVIFEDGHVAANFRDAAQCVNTQGSLGLLWWLWKTLGQIRALHGLWNISAIVIVAATTVVASALVSVALVVLAIVAATAASAGAAGAVATIGVLTLVFILRALLGVTGIFVLLHCRISCRIVRCLENRRSRLIRSGFLRLRRWTRLSGYLTGAVSGFIHSLRTPAFFIVSRRPSSSSASAPSTGNRGSPTSMPCIRRASFASVTPPRRACCSARGIRVCALISRARSISPRSKASHSSASSRGAAWPTTEMNPDAPTDNQGRLRGSSPEYHARSVSAIRREAAAKAPFASFTPFTVGSSDSRSKVSVSTGIAERPG